MSSSTSEMPDTVEVLKLDAIKQWLREDLKAADVKWSLFLVAANSYRHDTVLRPFPPMCQKNGGTEIHKDFKRVVSGVNKFLPPSWRHTHAHFGFAHCQQPLRWLKPFLKHWYVKLYELIAPHTLKWINSVIKLGHFVWNIIYCLSRIKFKDRWVVFFIYDSFCWTKSPTAAGLGSRNDAM